MRPETQLPTETNGDALWRSYLPLGKKKTDEMRDLVLGFAYMATLVMISILKESTKVPEGMRKETKSQQKKFKEKLEDEKEKATREGRSRVQLNEKIKDLEDMRMELESQQKALKDSLVQEKRKVSCEKRSRVKVEKKLKKVKERNTKLEDEVRQLKERLLAEESISKEVQTSSLKNLIAKKDSMKSSFFPEQSVFDSAMMEQNIRYAERRKRRSRSRSRRRAREMLKMWKEVEVEVEDVPGTED
ncbi:hypothetical protein BSL78_14638 [Apostichopus japonicus]|uniref:Uncharacterized protein n=1 Tax=Stichopus japonicus TaxID=307972 RepID=A0A2G8KKG0_STIJA|nr:hypothetical protein BSL78_14638 [Apostichopus japonicus]